MFFLILLLMCFEISCSGKFFDGWPCKLRKWLWFLANVAVNACQDLTTLEGVKEQVSSIKNMTDSRQESTVHYIRKPHGQAGVRKMGQP
jgi:hypothetical protein